MFIQVYTSIQLESTSRITTNQSGSKNELKIYLDMDLSIY